VVSIKGMVDREQRKNNIVVYNMPESQASTPQVRQEEEMKAVSDMMRDGAGVTELKIRRVTRLGGIDQNRQNKPRVLLVQFEDVSYKKHQFLANVKRFRNAEKWRKYTIPISSSRCIEIPQD